MTEVEIALAAALILLGAFFVGSLWADDFLWWGDVAWGLVFGLALIVSALVWWIDPVQRFIWWVLR